MFKIFIAFADGKVANAANHFEGVLHNYPSSETAHKAMAFLKKDSPKIRFFIQGARG